MSRVTISEVLNILPKGVGLNDDQIAANITAANCIVDQVASGCGSHLTDKCLAQVELYTAAHYAAATELSLSRKSERDPCGSSATYGFELGEGIKGSPFGQMANTLSGGCLAEFDKQPTNIFSIGCH